MTPTLCGNVLLALVTLLETFESSFFDVNRNTIKRQQEKPSEHKFWVLVANHPTIIIKLHLITVKGFERAVSTEAATEGVLQKKKKKVLKNFANFTGKHLCWSLSLIRETPTQVFSCEICEFCRTPILKNICVRLLLPLDGTHLVAVRGLTTKRYSSQERQWEELVGAALLRPIRTNRSSLTCQCQFPDSR